MNMDTVFVNYFISNGLCIMVVAMFWYQNRKRFEGLDVWLVGFTIQITGVALFVFRANAPQIFAADFFNSSSFDILIILMHQMLFVFGAFIFFLMINQRLVTNLENDIAKHKQLEKSLIENQNLADGLYETMPEALLTVDGEGKIVRANNEVKKIFGYTHEELLGQPVELLIPKRYRSDHIHNVTGFLDKPSLSAMRLNPEVFGIKKNGNEFPVEIQLSSLNLDTNIFVTSLIRDLTEPIQNEISLRQVQSQLIEQQRTLAAFEERENMARDLHDGLGQTLGYVNVQAQAVHDLLIKDEKEAAMQLLGRLLEVTQEAHGDLRGYILGLKNETVALRQDFLTALLQYCQHLRQTYEFQVALLLPEDLPAMLAATAVETQLIYIIREALSNSQRHSGVLHATVTITFDDENVHFVVQDMGEGIGVEYAGPERRKVAHFGLEMMKERAEQVGGSIDILSAPGAGMKVSGWLPRKLSLEDLPSARILLADDHPLFLDGLRNLLTIRGMQVVGTASDGFEAVEMARKTNPDIIAMDIQMPRCNGLEATRLIKAEMPNVKIVMLTTSADEENLFEALRNGASGYLLKAMGIDEFLSLLKGLFHGESVFSPGLANKTLEVFTSSYKTGKRSELTSEVELTERQLDVLRLVSQGLMYKEIGSRLFLTERTVKYHIGEILGRLHLKTRREAIEYAKGRGLV